MALFANSLPCNGASAAEGRPSVARLASSRQPVTHQHMNDQFLPSCTIQLSVRDGVVPRVNRRNVWPPGPLGPVYNRKHATDSQAREVLIQG